MRLKLIIISIVTIVITISCSERTKNIDSLETLENGLTCENIYLSHENNEINNKTTFIYGEKFQTNFSGIDGFVKENGYVFPGLELLITNIQGDTVLFHKDLYPENNGYNLFPLLLHTNITVAKPMSSNHKYFIKSHVWDKKGDASFTAKMNFNVVPNDNITIANDNVTYDDVYLFAQKRRETILADEAKINEKMYFIFEGLDGFKPIANKISLGISLKATDNKGQTILYEEDAMKNKTISLKDFKKSVAPYFIFDEPSLNNPILCEVNIWDKNSNRKIKTSTEISFKK